MLSAGYFPTCYRLAPTRQSQIRCLLPTRATAVTSSAEGRELFTCSMRLSFRGGSVVTVPMVSFSSKADAEAFNKERSGFLGAVAQGMAALPAPGRAVELPVQALLGELGIVSIGLGIEQGELRNSSLVVPKPSIILSS